MKQIQDRSKNNFKKGSIEMLILHILQEEDCYGYDIAQRIKARSDGKISVLEGSMYPVLYRMAAAGYISEKEIPVGKRRVRVYYHLEDFGRARLAELRKDYEEVISGINNILSYPKI